MDNSQKREVLRRSISILKDTHNQLRVLGQGIPDDKWRGIYMSNVAPIQAMAADFAEEITYLNRAEIHLVDTHDASNTQPTT